MDPLDELVAIAADVAVDLEVGTLRDTGRSPPFVKPQRVAEHTRHHDFIKSLEEDPVLGKLFPDDDEQRGYIRTFRPRTLAVSLINAALWRCTLAGIADSEDFVGFLKSGLGSIGDLTEGRSVVGTLVTGFNFPLPTDESIDTPWGVLRNRRPLDTLVLSGLGAGEQIPDGGSILETPVDLFWPVIPGEGPGVDRLTGLEDYRWKLLSLSVLLACREPTLRPAIPWCCTRINPLSWGTGGGSLRTQFIKGPYPGDVDWDALPKWFERMDVLRGAEVAVHRVLTMTERNIEHVDAFIDAVIVWENLFGTGDNQELSYRVSMNMAAVLSDDPDERVALQSEIKSLYNKRSRVVHGGTHLTPTEGRELRFRAQELTFRALRRVVSEHPDLVGAQQPEFVKFLFGAQKKE